MSDDDWRVLDEDQPYKQWENYEEKLLDAMVQLSALGAALDGTMIPGLRPRDVEILRKEIEIIKGRLQDTKNYAALACTESRERTLFDLKSNVYRTFIDDKERS